MSPAVVNSVHELLTEKQREHEAYFGEIPISEKFESRKMSIYDLKFLMI
jgi:hypothetical protein